MKERDPNVGKDFFKKLKLKQTDLTEKLRSGDKPRFKIEDLAGNYRVFTLRQEEDRYKHWYCTTIFNGPEPKDIIVQTRNEDFEEAIKTHYSALDYLEQFKK